MQELNLFKIFSSRLNQAEISYIVTGSVAGIIYGQPRVTHDVDLVVELDKKQLSQFLEKFPPQEFYCPPEEVIRIEIARETRGHFNIIHHKTGFKADIYPKGTEHLHTWAMANRKKTTLDNDTFYLAPPEYVIVRKLQYYQEGKSAKHLDDIRNILEISPDLIDHKTLLNFIKQYNLQNQWNKISKDVTF